MEEKITVRMTDTYLFDFTLYHTYSKLAGFLTNILGAAIAFMGIIMLVMGKIKPVQIIFYLVAAVVFIAYTPLLLKYRSKKQVKGIERYHVPNEMTFNDEGIQVEFADKKETYEWEQIQKVVKETLERLEVNDVNIRIVDKGALDCTIKARVECAVYRSVGQKKNLPWGGVIR